MTKKSVDDWYSTTMFAVRLQGEEGWSLGCEAITLEEAKARMEANGHVIEDIVEISRGAGRDRDENGEPSLMGVDNFVAQSHGWTRDDLAGCWRAPGENVVPFPSTPARADSVEFEFGRPEAGWLAITVRAAGRKLEIHASEVFCPFADLLSWLEGVSEGRDHRVTVDLEGAYAEFMAFPEEDPDRVRIVGCLSGNATEDGGREIKLDISVDRRRFVEAFYGAFRRYADGAHFDPYEWAPVSIHEDLRNNYPSLPVAELRLLGAAEVDALLWELYPSYIVSFPDLPTEGDEVLAFVNSVSGDKDEELDGLVETPNPRFVVAEEYDTWGPEQRAAHLDELFQESVTSWHGDDLRNLRSKKIERYLRVEMGTR